MRCPHFYKGKDGHDYCVVELCGVRVQCNGQATKAQDCIYKGIRKDTGNRCVGYSKRQ